MPHPTVTASVELKLAELAERWSRASAGEKANAQLYLVELCDALGVARPLPAGGGYQFEQPVKVVTPQGLETTHFIDLYKRGHYVLEAKDEEPGRSTDLLLRKAFGQAVNYAINLPEGAPPFLLVLDVGATLLVWQRRSGTYGGFNAAHRIAEVAERLDRHRKDALARDERVTMTGMYNVVEKLRAGGALTPKERAVHEIAACGVLRDLHDELDRLVAEAYGWAWPLPVEEILARLVALHDERVAEERTGRVRWLRPDYQRPRFGKDVAGQAEAALAAGRKRARAGAAKKRA